MTVSGDSEHSCVQIQVEIQECAAAYHKARPVRIQLVSAKKTMGSPENKILDENTLRPQKDPR